METLVAPVLAVCLLATLDLKPTAGPGFGTIPKCKAATVLLTPSEPVEKAADLPVSAIDPLDADIVPAAEVIARPLRATVTEL